MGEFKEKEKAIIKLESALRQLNKAYKEAIESGANISCLSGELGDMKVVYTTKDNNKVHWTDLIQQLCS